MATAQNSTLQLAIDTSSKLTSLYCARGREVVGTLSVRMNDRRSERLWSQVEFLLDEIDLDIKDMDLFSVCTGPGGFTGIRVGMAAAKGLAMAGGRPLVGVTSLEAAAAAAGPAPAVLAMVRAHKGEVFSQLFRCDDPEMPVAQDTAVVGSPEDALEKHSSIKQLVIVGDAATDNADLIKSRVSQQAPRGRRDWILGPSLEALAPSIARIALARFSRGDHMGDVRACYVRQSQAETKLALGLVGPGLRR
jgi:tRNA threonylcarbamoyladenosine biosynthesis protein TsaB